MYIQQKALIIDTVYEYEYEYEYSLGPRRVYAERVDLPVGVLERLRVVIHDCSIVRAKSVSNRHS